MGFRGGTSLKEPACQYRRHKQQVFSPLVWKIPWRRAWQPTPLENPMGRGGWLATVHSVVKSWAWLKRPGTRAYMVFWKGVIEMTELKIKFKKIKIYTFYKLLSTCTGKKSEITDSRILTWLFLWNSGNTHDLNFSFFWLIRMVYILYSGDIIFYSKNEPILVMKSK